MLGEELVLGFSIGVSQLDVDRDSTWVNWEVPDPIFAVIRDHNNIHGVGCRSDFKVPVEVQVEIHHDGTLAFNYSLMTDENGSFDLHVFDYTMVAGDEVVVFYGTSTKVHIVTSLTITLVDYDANYIQGTATADTAFDYWSISENAEGVVVDSSGIWTIDFPVGVLVPGFWIEVSQSDEDGDKTSDLFEISE